MDETNVQTQLLAAASDSNGEDSTKTENAPLPLDKRICLVGSAAQDAATCKAAQNFGVPVITSDTGIEYVDDDTCTTVFVLDDFDGADLKKLQCPPHRVLGTVALQQLSERREDLPNNSRPLFNLAMWGVVVCFTGFRKKEDLTRLIPFIHHMGGSIRKDMVAKVTHLIANCCGGDKYRYALTFKVPVMDQSWVRQCWEGRADPSLDAAAADVVAAHRLQPFCGARVCFLGFPADEARHMCEVLQANGGQAAQPGDGGCTHVVVDESAVTERPDGCGRALLVKAEWFWASVQNESCAYEKDYLFEQYLEGLASPGRRDSHTPGGATPGAATPGSSSSRRKRKRLQETLSSLVRHESPAFHKRRSSVSDAALLSVSGSFLDCTASPDKALLDQAEGPAAEPARPKSPLSPRQLVFLELVQTESNYVNILHTLVTMFKKHLEDMAGAEALLNPTELKMIFGHLPPLYDVHRRMLDDLRQASAHWGDGTSVGAVLLAHAADLLKAYPPFVNSFEATKAMLAQCDQSKPRFHAFLKVCQTRPECGRQTLQDLLIRPVQRLPSIGLLLGDILKQTPRAHPDHAALERALHAIREATAHINEDKRRAEGQRVMFDIFNEIDSCPADLVSSHRSLVARCEATDLSHELSGRGHALVLLLFSDQLVVCKKRSRAFNSLKSPTAHAARPGAKPYKYVLTMALGAVKRVIDIRETDECQRVFALVHRDNQDLRERLFTFALADEDADKAAFLRTLCRQLAHHACSADADKFLVSLEPQQLDIDTRDVPAGTLSKAFKFATRTKIRVGRAFSFNKTPSKLKRAMSTMMSPFGSSTNITPASQLAQMRLASYNNINELGGGPAAGDGPARDALVAPLSAQPARKLKCSSLSVTALKRL